MEITATHQISCHKAAGPLFRNTKKPIRRRISPEAGRAISLLGHAIEYLTDEYIHATLEAGENFRAGAPQLEAVQILMAANREIYFACPEVHSLADRLWGLLHLRAA